MFRQDYARFSIFAGLNNCQINHLLPYLQEARFPEDSHIFEQGQPAENLYILLSGEVVIRYKPYDGPPLTVARIMPGGVFGWSAALHRDVYTSGAAAVQDSLAYCIRGASLAVILKEHPQTGEILLDRLASVIAQRLQDTHTQVLGILVQGIDEYSCK
jgi:CRP-like cAMP-binding protein